MSAVCPLEQAAPGMELTREVWNTQGMCLLAAGTVLTPRHLKMLRAWGVAQVTIAGDPGAHAAPPAQMSRHGREALADELGRMFGSLVEDPRMAEIFRVALLLRGTRSGPLDSLS